MTKTVNPKVQEFLTMLKDPDVYSAFQDIVMGVLTDPNGPQLSRRITNIERHLGASDDWCVWEDVFNEDKEILMPLTEQFDLLSGRIEDVSLPVLKETVFAGNKTETRAKLLFDFLKEIPFKNGKQFMTGPDVAKWLLNEIEEKYRTTKSGSRQASRDVMEKTRELHPDEIKLYLVSDKQNHKRGKNIIEYVGIAEHVSMY